MASPVPQIPRRALVAYGFYYDLDPFSDFTYYLTDSNRGNQFEQRTGAGWRLHTSCLWSQRRQLILMRSSCRLCAFSRKELPDPVCMDLDPSTRPTIDDSEKIQQRFVKVETQIGLRIRNSTPSIRHNNGDCSVEVHSNQTWLCAVEILWKLNVRVTQ